MQSLPAEGRWRLVLLDGLHGEDLSCSKPNVCVCISPGSQQRQNAVGEVCEDHIALQWIKWEGLGVWFRGGAMESPYPIIELNDHMISSFVGSKLKVNNPVHAQLHHGNQPARTNVLAQLRE